MTSEVSDFRICCQKHGLARGLTVRLALILGIDLPPVGRLLHVRALNHQCTPPVFENNKV